MRQRAMVSVRMRLQLRLPATLRASMRRVVVAGGEIMVPLLIQTTARGRQGLRQTVLLDLGQRDRPAPRGLDRPFRIGDRINRYPRPRVGA
jgi:hypothetical protein